MSDLVQRLRDGCLSLVPDWQILLQAASRIEQLERINRQLSEDKNSLLVQGAALERSNKELREALELARPCLEDLISHHNDFRSACGTRYRADFADYGKDSASYWEHQQKVLDRMKEQAESALSAADANKESS